MAPVSDADALADRVLGQALGVFRPGDRLVVEEEAEAVVDALVEDAAQPLLALDEEDVLGPGALGAQGRGQAGRPAADDHDVARFDSVHVQPLIRP